MSEKQVKRKRKVKKEEQKSNLTYALFNNYQFLTALNKIKQAPIDWLLVKNAMDLVEELDLKEKEYKKLRFRVLEKYAENWEDCKKKGVPPVFKKKEDEDNANEEHEKILEIGFKLKTQIPAKVGKVQLTLEEWLLLNRKTGLFTG